MGTLHMPKSATDTICESYVFQSETATIVIDGGFESETESLYALIKSLGGNVDAWFFSHPHDDHYGAFCGVMKEHADEIHVKALYYNFPADELIIENAPRFADATRKYLPMIRELTAANSIPVITMHKGDVYDFGDFSIHVLREPDVSITNNFINNSTTVFRLDSNGRRIMFLGDLGVEGGEQLLATVPAEELKSEFVQMAHHGQQGVEKPVYDVISPDFCLWNTPTWLWDNMGDNGYDTGKYKTVIVRGWMSEIGIKKHYVNMNGPFEIEI